MKIFLAGGNQKNNIIKKHLNEMKIYLAGRESRHWLNYPLLEDKNENIPCRIANREQSMERGQDKALIRGVTLTI